MKYFLLFLIFIGVCSCIPNETLDILDVKEITFNTGYSIETRASIEAAGMTDLYVLEDTTIILHQTSTQSSFGSPSLSLSYGSHSLKFLTTKSSDPKIEGGIFSCSKTLDTFTKTVNITVTSNTPTKQELTLERVVYGIGINVKDILPSDIYDLEIIIHDHSLTYNLSTGYGSSKDYSRVFDLSSLANKQSTQTYIIYGFLVNGIDNVDVILNFRREDGGSIINRTIEDIPIKANQKTYINGYFLDATQGVSLQANSTWLNNVEIDYNNR